MLTPTVGIRPYWQARLACVALLVVVAGVALSGRAAIAKGAIAFVVPKSSGVSNLSSGELRRILLGEETQWPNKDRITILLLPPGNEQRKLVLKTLLGMSDDDFVRHWISQVFQGQATSGPKTASSPMSMVKLVAGLPDALGIVATDDLPSGDSGLKVLAIDGKTPGESGYLFAR